MKYTYEDHEMIKAAKEFESLMAKESRNRLTGFEYDIYSLRYQVKDIARAVKPDPDKQITPIKALKKKMDGIEWGLRKKIAAQIKKHYPNSEMPRFGILSLQNKKLNRRVESEPIKSQLPAKQNPAPAPYASEHIKKKWGELAQTIKDKAK